MLIVTSPDHFAALEKLKSLLDVVVIDSTWDFSKWLVPENHKSALTQSSNSYLDKIKLIKPDGIELSKDDEKIVKYVSTGDVEAAFSFPNTHSLPFSVYTRSSSYTPSFSLSNQSGSYSAMQRP